MKQKNRYHMNIGGASILLILVIFSLTIFAILSLRASYHEVKMSEKTKTSVEAYYEADAKAEEILMQVSEAVISQENTLDLVQLVNDLSTVENLEIDESTHILTYIVSMDYNRTLEVKLQLPKKSKDKITIYSWKMISTEQGDYVDSGMEDIWDGLLDE